jgi:hypothetical protein
MLLLAGCIVWVVVFIKLFSGTGFLLLLCPLLLQKKPITVRGDFLGIDGRDPSLSKSDRLWVVIFSAFPLLV